MHPHSWSPLLSESPAKCQPECCLMGNQEQVYLQPLVSGWLAIFGGSQQIEAGDRNGIAQAAGARAGGAVPSSRLKLLLAAAVSLLWEGAQLSV